MKLLKIGIYDLIATGIILLAAGLRVLLDALGWPPTNADEGTMGIMALHIAYRGERPLLFYGQNYMGSLEAYLGAMFFHLFGPSLFSLRLGVILLAMLFFVSTYILTSIVYSKQLAVVTLALLSFGSIQLFSREMLATGGSTQTLLFGSLAFLGAVCLAVTRQAKPFVRGQLWRMLGYFCWGAVLGLGMWSDMVVLPFFAMAVLLLLVCCWRDLLWSWLFITVGFIAGIFPLLLYNMQNTRGSHGTNSLTTLLGLFHGTTTQAPHTLPQLLYGFWNTLTISVPIATGNPFCPVQELVGQGDNVVQTSSCVLGHAVWGLGYVFLLLSALARTLHPLVTRREGIALPLVFARLAMQFAAILAIIAYAISSAPMGWPGYHARYLVGLLIITPVLLAPLWDNAFLRASRSPVGAGVDDVVGWGPLRSLAAGDTVSLWVRFAPHAIRFPAYISIGRIFRYPRRRATARVPTPHPLIPRPYGKAGSISGRARIIISRVVLVAIFAVLIIGTGLLLSEVPATQAAKQREADLIHGLMKQGIVHIYTDYWSCDSIAFLSNEQIICGVIDGNLRFSHNRDPRYAQIVGSDPHSAYVLPVGAGQLRAIEHKAAQSPGRYRHYILNGYVIYQPT